MGWQVGTYQIYHYPGQRAIRGLIRLVESGGSGSADLWFLDDPRDRLASNSQRGNYYSLRFTYDQFLPVVDMIRNEKPIWIVDSSYSVAVLGTSAEPVGEEEGA